MRINIDIKDSYSGAGVRQALRDIEALSKGISAMPPMPTGGAAGAMPQTGAVAAAQASGGPSASGVAQSANNMNTAARATGGFSREIRNLQKDIHNLDRDMQGMQGKALQSLQAHSAAMKSQLVDLQALQTAHVKNNAVASGGGRGGGPYGGGGGPYGGGAGGRGGAVASARSQMFENRSDSMSQMMAGSIIENEGRQMLGVMGASIQEYGTFQLARIGTEALDGAGAPRVIEQAREQAKNTYGANYKEILGYQNQLVNQGTSRDEAQKLTKELGDINASMGGTSAIFQRIMYNLSQVESMGRLTGLDNRQFQQARINLNPLLAKQMGVDVSEVRDKISDGEVTSEMVRKAIHEMGNDPRFKDRGKIISDTTALGQIEKTAASFGEVAEAMGKEVAPALGMVLSNARGFADFVKENPAMTRGAAYGLTGVGGAATVVGGAMALRGTLGVVANAFPRMQNSPFVNRFIGRGQTPLNPLFVMPVGGGLGGLPAAGATGAAARAAAAAPLAAAPWLRSGVFSGLSGAGLALSGAAAQGGVMGGIASGLAGLTKGAALRGGAVGLGAGLGAREDYGSDAAGIGVGLSAAALAAFSPAAAAIIGAATLLRAGVKSMNDNEDKRLEEGNGLSAEAIEETKGESLGQLMKRREAFADLSKEQRAKADDARGGFYGTGFDPFGAHAKLGEQYDMDALNSQSQAGNLTSRIKALPAEQLKADSVKSMAAFMAQHQNDPGQDSGAISNRKPGAFATFAQKQPDPWDAMPEDAPILGGSRGKGPQIEVKSIEPSSNEVMLVTLAIPTHPAHPDIRGMFNNLKDATRI